MRAEPPTAASPALDDLRADGPYPAWKDQLMLFATGGRRPLSRAR
jgi:hypothetical protein